MGCFLKCFGGSKDVRCRRKRYTKVVSRDHRDGVKDSRGSIESTVQDTTETHKSPTNLVPELSDEVEKQLNPSPGKTEERFSPSPRKRVTFNSNVTTYEPVSEYESTDSLADTKKVTDEENVVNPGKDHSVSEDGSVISSVGSYPSNHRYENCRGSDDEAEEYGDSELEDDNDDEDCEDDLEDDDEYDEDVDGGIIGEVWSESVLTASMASRTRHSLAHLNSEEVNSQLKLSCLPEQETKAIGVKGYIRDRSAYIHPVLNPVENLTQWKAVKSKSTPPVKRLKENFTGLEPSHIPLSEEPTFKQSSCNFKPKPTQNKDFNQAVAVDASLSNWLASPETTPGRSASPGSNSVISFEDRPILGALTVEELKQLSASSSPRKSPSRSPDDMPIIGSVGAYWKETSVIKDSASASSTTRSNYREVSVK